MMWFRCLLLVCGVLFVAPVSSASGLGETCTTAIESNGRKFEDADRSFINFGSKTPSQTQNVKCVIGNIEKPSDPLGLWYKITVPEAMLLDLALWFSMQGGSTHQESIFFYTLKDQAQTCEKENALECVYSNVGSSKGQDASVLLSDHFLGAGVYYVFVNGKRGDDVNDRRFTLLSHATSPTGSRDENNPYVISVEGSRHFCGAFDDLSFDNATGTYSMWYSFSTLNYDGSFVFEDVSGGLSASPNATMQTMSGGKVKSETVLLFDGVQSFSMKDRAKLRLHLNSSEPMPRFGFHIKLTPSTPSSETADANGTSTAVIILSYFAFFYAAVLSTLVVVLYTVVRYKQLHFDIPFNPKVWGFVLLSEVSTLVLAELFVAIVAVIWGPSISGVTNSGIWFVYLMNTIVPLIFITMACSSVIFISISLFLWHKVTNVYLTLVMFGCNIVFMMSNLLFIGLVWSSKWTPDTAYLMLFIMLFNTCVVVTIMVALLVTLIILERFVAQPSASPAQLRTEMRSEMSMPTPVPVPRELVGSIEGQPQFTIDDENDDEVLLDNAAAVGTSSIPAMGSAVHRVQRVVDDLDVDLEAKLD